MPWYYSCSNLLPSLTIKVVFVIISIIIIAGNLMSLLLKYKALGRKLHGKVFNIIVCCINSGDLLCGTYLIILWITDTVYGNKFIVLYHSWRNSFVCHTSFAMVLTFNLLVPYLLCFLSMARLMVVIFPVDTKFKSPTCVFRYIMSGVLLYIHYGKLYLHKQKIFSCHSISFKNNLLSIS